MKKSKPKTVELVKSTYRPTKAEININSIARVNHDQKPT